MTVARLRRNLTQDPERGSVTIWMITTALTMVLLVGLAVDLGGQVLAKQHAQAIAVEAARAGGQKLIGPAAVQGQGAFVDPTAAVGAVTAYLAGAPGVSGTATIAGPTVIVQTSTTYRTKFLGLIGIRELTVTGQAEVQVVRAVEGVTR